MRTWSAPSRKSILTRWQPDLGLAAVYARCGKDRPGKRRKIEGSGVKKGPARDCRGSGLVHYASVLQMPMRLGAIQKLLERVAQAIEPHYSAIATQARYALVNYIDETPWFLTNTLQWLWVMASDTVALSMSHPHRSKEVLAALIDDWASILVSDDYGVYQTWMASRQT